MDANLNDSSKPTVIVSEPLNERALAYVAAHAELIRTTAEQVNRGQADDALARADGMCVRTYTLVNEDLLARAPRLKVVGRAGVALDNIDVPACRARSVQVVHTPEANTLAVVDYTLAAMLRMNRRYWPITGHVSPEQFHETRKRTFGRFLSGAVLGIVGMGRIGSRVGKAAAAMGMRVLYNDIIDIELDYPAEPVDKQALYAASDIVTIHVPLTDLTRRMINAGSLSQFKAGAQFINAARGQSVDYAALGEALRNGPLAYATIDCHDPEPPPPDYPLFGLDNVFLTPHIAARVPQAVENMCDVVYDIIAVLQGEQPQFPARQGAY